MSYRKIQAALDSHLLASAESRIAFPGRPFHVGHDTAYVAVAFEPAPVRAVFLGPDGPELHSGIYRLTLYDPEMIAAETRLDALRSHFNRGRLLTFEGLDVHLDGASAAAAEADPRRVILPLLISWRSYF